MRLGLPPEHTLHEGGVILCEMHQDGDSIDRKELRNPQLVSVDPDLVHLQVNLGDVYTLVAKVEPDIHGLPVINRVDGVGVRDALAAYAERRHVLEALDGFGGSDAGQHDPVPCDTRQEGLVVVHPRLEQWVVSDGEGRRLPHPQVPLDDGPQQTKGLVAGQLR